MFVYYDKEKTRVPIKIWTENIEDIEPQCLEQAVHLSNLPFVYKWVSLMPDTHTGKGMPIGAVIACEDAVIPNAVGVDIGCGMAFVQTDIPANLLRETMTGSGELIKNITGAVLRAIPVGFSHYSKPQPSAVLDKALEQSDRYINNKELFDNISEGYFQIGTLGGGNHFIEIQEDENGLACIMLHSGSRNFGYTVGKYFNSLAAELNARWHSAVPPEYNLPFLPVSSTEGHQYLNWMHLSMDFAYENRETMLHKVKNIFSEMCEKYLGKTPVYSNQINCHHNYAALENHFGKNVWVHRKGAVRAAAGKAVIIPGAMGSYSYIADGLENAESFCSSSHGAGRRYSRTAAREKFSVEKVIVDLKNRGVFLGKHNKSDVADESRFAYKDIDIVMKNQQDLAEPVKKLFTTGVVKG